MLQTSRFLMLRGQTHVWHATMACYRLRAAASARPLQREQALACVPQPELDDVLIQHPLRPGHGQLKCVQADGRLVRAGKEHCGALHGAMTACAQAERRCIWQQVESATNNALAPVPSTLNLSP